MGSARAAPWARSAVVIWIVDLQVSRVPSPKGNRRASSLGLLPSPVRAGSGSAGLWPCHTLSASALPGGDVQLAGWYRRPRQPSTGARILLTRSRIQPMMSLTTIAPSARCGPRGGAPGRRAGSRPGMPSNTALLAVGTSRSSAPWTTSVWIDSRLMAAETRACSPNAAWAKRTVRLVLVERVGDVRSPDLRVARQDVGVERVREHQPGRDAPEPADREPRPGAAGPP